MRLFYFYFFFAKDFNNHKDISDNRKSTKTPRFNIDMFDVYFLVLNWMLVILLYLVFKNLPLYYELYFPLRYNLR